MATERTARALLVSLVLVCATSCVQIPTVQTRTCSLDYSLCSEVTEFISFDDIEAGFRRAGLKVISSEGDAVPDFAITVSVANFPAKVADEAFCSFEYDIHYKDTYFSVSPKIWFHGEVDAQRVRIGFEHLNQHLAFVLDHFPIPQRDEEHEENAAEPGATDKPAISGASHKSGASGEGR